MLLEAAVKSSTILKFALSSLIGLSLAACSSSSGGGGSDDGGGTADTGGVKTDTAGGGTDTAGGGTDTAGGTDAPKTDTKTGTDTGGGGDDACGAEASQSKCQSCCAANHMDSYKAFATALLTCACKAGNCDTDCKDTACAATPATPSAACTTCLGKVQSGACKADLDACKAAACAPFFDCVGAQCAGKP